MNMHFVLNAHEVPQAPQQQHFAGGIAHGIVGIVNAAGIAIQHEAAAAAAAPAPVQVQPVPEAVVTAIERILAYWRERPFMAGITNEQLLEKVPHDRLLAMAAAIQAVLPSKRKFEEATAALLLAGPKKAKKEAAEAVASCFRVFRENEFAYQLGTLMFELKDRVGLTLQKYAEQEARRSGLVAQYATEQAQNHAAGPAVVWGPNLAVDGDRRTVFDR